MPAEAFVAAVSFICGLFAWAQMPAVCGFMLSSTRAGAGNYIYSIWLGALIAVVGLGTGVPSLLKGGRRALLLAGLAASAGFIAAGLLGQEQYGAACHAVYEALITT